MRTILRIPFKIIALPFMLALMLITAFLCFLQVIGETVLMYVAGLLALLGIASFFMANGNPFYIKTGIIGLVFGFLLSPFGLPALAGLLIKFLDNIKFSLQSFITS